MIKDATHRIRAFLNEPSVKVGRVARDAGLSWETVEKVKRGRGDPAETTLIALEEVIPPDYAPSVSPDVLRRPRKSHSHHGAAA